MNVIIDRYNHRCSEDSDIRDHIPTLRRYASDCAVVAEMGVRAVVSTWGILLGLAESRCDRPRSMYCVDLAQPPGISEVISLAKQVSVDLQYFQSDSAKVVFPEPVDMLFIDTWHVYGHLKRELAHHHEKVNKYIIMHDTEVDRVFGESLRCGWDVVAQSQSSGYPEEEISCGLQKAIDEFLEAHPEWTLLEHFVHNNGLTVLARRPRVP